MVPDSITANKIVAPDDVTSDLFISPTLLDYKKMNLRTGGVAKAKNSSSIEKTRFKFEKI